LGGGGAGVKREHCLAGKKTLDPLLAGVAKNWRNLRKSQWPLPFTYFLPTLQACGQNKKNFSMEKPEFFTAHWVSKNGLASNAHLG
jgi:hypothetical protein